MVDDPALVVHDLLDTQVDVRAETPVELELTAARQFTRRRGAQIDEREPHRLLPLVHTVGLEGDRRDVRLDDLDSGGGIPEVDADACERDVGERAHASESMG
jgi:hypothetical protein